MTTLLEAYRSHNLLGLRDIFRRRKPPTALELAAFSLEETRRELLQSQESEEHHAAQTRMLKQRETRLVAEVRRLTEMKGKADADAAG